MAIIETGTNASAGRLLQGAGAARLAHEQVRYVVVTHVHLDHAGGAGQLMACLSGGAVAGAPARRPAHGRPVPAGGQRAAGVRRRGV